MNLRFATAGLVVLSFTAMPAVAQFLETPSDPPPSAKDLPLPVIFDTISGMDLVDEATPDGANGFIKNEAAAVMLGKALYWDQQVGSNNVACATCHYHAGADARERNQLSPGLKGGSGVFDPTATGGGGPNYKLRKNDFPTHQLSDPTDRDSAVLFDSDDVVSSQGTFLARFNDIRLGEAIDDCTPGDYSVFQVYGKNTRRVEPRNTPTTIFAAFNHRNFWDGRANNIFNGVDGSGQRNTEARVLENQGGSVAPIQIALQNASLASQAVIPIVSDFEMSCAGRTRAKIGKKMLSLRVLRKQRVHFNDSVLGHVSAWPRYGTSVDGTRDGNKLRYTRLVKDAISNRFWNSDALFDADQNPVGSGDPGDNTDLYTQMESNFGMIFGLAVQAYIRTLNADNAPYDQWAEAPGGRSPTEDNTKGILTEQQMRGMNLFFTNEIGPGTTAEEKIGLRANCSTCHQGPLFTTATFPFTIEEESGEFPEQEQLVERMRRGDGINIIEDLFRYFIAGEGQIGPFLVSGTAGARELPNIWRATVGGDITLNGVPCTVESFLMNQDRTAPFPELMVPPEAPESRGESPYADYSTKDAVFRVTGCGGASEGPQGLEITINDNYPDPDTATIKSVMFPGSYAPTTASYPIRAIYAATIVDNVEVGGDFSLEIPTLYDTAFYNIGVRPSAEDPGVAAVDEFGVPLSITQQWIDQLLGTPGADVAALRSLNFGRVVEPFNWYGDSVWFPGGFSGYAWMTHDFVVNPLYPGANCFEGFGQPELPQFDNEADCLADDEGNVWIVQTEYNLTPRVGEYFLNQEQGRGDDALPAYDPVGQPPSFIPNIANADAIATMPTALDGAFKVPNLRNVTLTAPYFHNGGQRTLREVIEFYNRGGDFATENLGDLAPNIHPLDLDDEQIDDIVAFLETLTDRAVACEKAPFDHPQITINPGHLFDENFVFVDEEGQAADRFERIPATGARGRRPRGLPCIDRGENFLETRQDAKQ